MRYFLANFICFVLIFLLKIEAYSGENEDLNSFLDKTKITGRLFLSYNYNEKEDRNSFLFKRGYLTIKNSISDVFSVRFTQDITLDKEGEDAGNVEMRLKYLYMKIKLDEIHFLKDSYLEIGLAHRPWLSFEEHINRYRVQGTMFIERMKIMNSADYGIYFGGLFGGEIDKDYQESVNSNNQGRYGSFAVGIYNGGGYHAIERNDNKNIEGRLSIRPLPNLIKGFHFGYGFAFGQGNIEEAPDFSMNLLYTAYESVYARLMGQYYAGWGDSHGNIISPEGSAYFNKGFSIFGEANIPDFKLSLIGRYDYFQTEKDVNIVKKVLIGGIAWHFFKNNKLLLDAQRTTEADKDYWIYEAVLEVRF